MTGLIFTIVGRQAAFLVLASAMADRIQALGPQKSPRGPHEFPKWHLALEPPLRPVRRLKAGLVNDPAQRLAADKYHPLIP